MRTSQDRPTESCAAVYVNVTLSLRNVTIQNQIDVYGPRPAAPGYRDTNHRRVSYTCCNLMYDDVMF